MVIASDDSPFDPGRDDNIAKLQQKIKLLEREIAGVPDDADERIDELEDRINLGKEQKFPKQKISQDIINAVRNNFEKYEDYQVFTKDFPAFVQPVLSRGQTNYPSENVKDMAMDPNESQALTPEEIMQGKYHDVPMIRKDHRISLEIDRVMKENFAFEQ